LDERNEYGHPQGCGHDVVHRLNDLIQDRWADGDQHCGHRACQWASELARRDEGHPDEQRARYRRQPEQRIESAD
jgi:hypothetical protein